MVTSGGTAVTRSDAGCDGRGSSGERGTRGASRMDPSDASRSGEQDASIASCHPSAGPGCCGSSEPSRRACPRWDLTITGRWKTMSPTLLDLTALCPSQGHILVILNPSIMLVTPVPTSSPLRLARLCTNGGGLLSSAAGKRASRGSRRPQSLLGTL